MLGRNLVFDRALSHLWRARDPGRALSRDEKRAVETRFRPSMKASTRISGRGGRVLKRFRHALNGIKIEIDRNEVLRSPRCLASWRSCGSEASPNNAVSVRSLARRRCGRARRVCAAKRQDRDHRYRDRLHARQLRRPRHRRRRSRAAAAAAHSRPIRRCSGRRAKGEGRHRSRRRRLQRERTCRQPGADYRIPTQSARLQRTRQPRRGHAAGFGVDAHGATYAGPYDSAAFSKRSRSDPESRPGRTSIPFASSAARVRPTS